ncbi:MAG: amino acid ABC transporter substrate-binding protein [Epulopiscium sp.]|nr:amino acid ABC transporter substrate-binding protein [Candidatus Epulonipiscium sp.]
MKIKDSIKKEYLFLSVLFLLTALIITSCGSNTKNETKIIDSEKSNKERSIESDRKEDKLVIAVGEWAPYTGEKLPNYGICSEVVAEVLNLMGIDYEFKFCPWERALKETEEGIVWGTFPWFYVEERLPSYFYSNEALWNSRVMLFYHKSNPNINGGNIVFDELEDLKTYKFGGARGYFYESIFREGKYRYELTVSIDNALQMLASDRVDFVMEDEGAGFDSIKRLFPDNVDDFGTLEKPYREEKMYLMVSKKYPKSKEYLKKFDEALKKYKESSKYQELMDKYGIVR